MLAELEANNGATLAGARAKRSPPRPTPAPPPTTPRSPTGSTANSAPQEAGRAHPPRRFAVGGKLKQSLRYGENPHQSAAFYVTGEKRYGVATAEQVGGKELSYNNINDTDAAYELRRRVRREGSAAVAIIKHANPCGVATAATLAEAYALALRCDPVSAFGGIVACNRTLDGATAEAARENLHRSHHRARRRRRRAQAS